MNEEEPINPKFGVKSYLHYFYEDCSGVGLCEVEQPAQLDAHGKRTKWFTCIGLCVAGFLVACTGLVLLVFGALNSLSDEKTLIGGCLLCVGGLTVAVFFTLIHVEIIKRRQEILEHECFQERCSKGMSIYRNRKLSSSSTNSSSSLQSSNDLPVSLYKVSAIQPLLDDPVELVKNLDDLKQSATSSGQ